MQVQPSYPTVADIESQLVRYAVPESSLSLQPVNDMKLDSLDTRLPEGIHWAVHHSFESGLPQTVYRDASSGGWWTMQALSPALGKAQVALTVLPPRWWS